MISQSVDEPPSRFIRKPKDTEQARLPAPRTCASAYGPVKQPELKPLAINRSQYNRLIGDVISADMECHCDDLPSLTLDQLGCFDALLLKVSEEKQ